MSLSNTIVQEVSLNYPPFLFSFIYLIFDEVLIGFVLSVCLGKRLPTLEYSLLENLIGVPWA